MVVLYRVDERLIHGQVVVGWGARLHPDRIVVVDDALAESDWEQELYTVGVPNEMTAEFDTVAAARDQLPEWQRSDERVLILTRDVATMNRLAATGLLERAEINLGGIHHAPGRTRVLRYVFLDDAERSQLRELSGRSGAVVARDLPGARGVPLEELVRTS
ncbi:MAG: PTS transporter subunit IIB [Gemmatimonadetes bacterium]|nr:PTS sugar transporter subunit IIB [Gemmatimonadota bacterium]NIQ58943.1 PTS sugar transporter subunit IIB [Gemmatimonadota bacterium]NIU79133.1 PTS transporter subunit IIB [Gammaproteobacteria bacterium]NIX47838.1 PTS transporter subunit IIB [Gemmatimonadota bacterium]NIY12203.1 PTS transporter subunit IIB [Gemmatimonadota bacterium]